MALAKSDRLWSFNRVSTSAKVMAEDRFLVSKGETLMKSMFVGGHSSFVVMPPLSSCLVVGSTADVVR